MSQQLNLAIFVTFFHLKDPFVLVAMIATDRQEWLVGPAAEVQPWCLVRKKGGEGKKFLQKVPEHTKRSAIY